MKELISIHAAREGGDVLGTGFNQRFKQFQSTPPVKAATIRNVKIVDLWAFQSTPPVKAATNQLNLRAALNGFQSTPPVKAATEYAVKIINASYNFNPRRP